MKKSQIGLKHLDITVNYDLFPDLGFELWFQTFEHYVSLFIYA